MATCNVCDVAEVYDLLWTLDNFRQILNGEVDTFTAAETHCLLSICDVNLKMRILVHAGRVNLLVRRISGGVSFWPLHLHICVSSAACNPEKRLEHRMVLLPEWLPSVWSALELREQYHLARFGHGGKMRLGKVSSWLRRLTDDSCQLSLSIEVKRLPWHSQVSQCLASDAVFQTFGGQTIILRSEDNFDVPLAEALVCQRSPVIAAAFSSDMREGLERVFRMANVSKQTLCDFAFCLQAGGLPSALVTQDWQRLLNLLVLADQYEVSSLAEALTSVLAVVVAPETAGAMLQLADEFSLLSLRRHVLNFAVYEQKHWNSIQKSQEYASFPADLLRDFHAYQPRLQSAGSQTEVPIWLQWASRAHEFPDETDWSRLDADAVRRASIERCLGTRGSFDEIVARLGEIGSSLDLPASKRPRRLL